MWSKAHCLAELDAQLPKGPFRVSVQFKLPILLPANVLFQTSQTDAGLEFEVRDAKGEKPHLAAVIQELA
jgi:hypothetical protein